MRKRWMALFMALTIGLSGCGRTDDPSSEAAEPEGYEAVPEEETPDPTREDLKKLQESPSVYSAVINSDAEGKEYRIDLEEATVLVWNLRSNEEIEYTLDSGQVEGLRQLLSGYALTVYDGNPYWPTGEYCTMIVLFDITIHYNGEHYGCYRETGALGYPEGWEYFMEKLKAFIEG